MRFRHILHGARHIAIMVTIEIPGRETLVLQNLVLDMNGTLALDGRLLAGVAERIARLRESLAISLISADTHGGLEHNAAVLGVQAIRLKPGDEAQQKAAWVESLGAASVVAIGNGANDVEMLRTAALGIAVLGEEGLAAECLLAADVVVPSIVAALDLMLSPRRLIATLRR
ncbi:MAG: HAD hydrolase family protein [Anaerolineae bacterium]|nr:HAD hydrolase family protein [Thermoflexales bacterium]MDW8408519.1 HAD hydrolase family protein [Anaerolineae bacterium]